MCHTSLCQERSKGRLCRSSVFLREQEERDDECEKFPGDAFSGYESVSSLTMWVADWCWQLGKKTEGVGFIALSAGKRYCDGVAVTSADRICNAEEEEKKEEPRHECSRKYEWGDK